jgi:hypothetical protein
MRDPHRPQMRIINRHFEGCRPPRDGRWNDFQKVNERGAAEPRAESFEGFGHLFIGTAQRPTCSFPSAAKAN